MVNLIQEDTKKIIKLIDEYTKVGKEMLNNFGKINDLKLYQYHTLVLLLERLTYNSISIKLILQEYEETKNEHLEYSIGLLLRNCCSDIITLIYINHLGSDMQYSTEKLEGKIKSLLGLEILRALKPYKNTDDTDEEKRKIKEEKYLEMKKGVAEKYHHFFSINEEGELKNEFADKEYHYEFTTTDMMDKSENYFKSFFSLPELWKYYCQYEHLGGLTHDILRMPFRRKIDDIINSTFNIISAMAIIVHNQNLPEFRKEEFTTKVNSLSLLYAEYFMKKH